MDTKKIEDLRAGAQDIHAMSDQIINGREWAARRRKERRDLSIIVHTSDGVSKFIVALGVLLALFTGGLVAVVAVYGLSAIF